MKRYVLLTEKSWHATLFENLKKRTKEEWVLINQKNDFCLEFLNEFNPDMIFIPHWSYIIPNNIWLSFPCVVFHMTDLPYGRGGSPLQNLIINGHKETKISALKVNEGIDTGDIYLKKALSLSGSAKDIFERSTSIIFDMIIEIIEINVSPKPQIGEPFYFKRRKPDESAITYFDKLDEIYDYIRMLDCEGYPRAFIETDYFKFEFSQAELLNNEITAHVRITKK